MTHRSVAAASLSHNDIVILSQLFEISIVFYRTHHSPYAQDFIAELRTIAGLGLTASLVDNGGLMPYQTYFNRFIQAENGNFLKDTGYASSLWGQTLAQMVAISLDSFRRLHYVDYYAHFRASLQKAIQNIRVLQEGKQKEAEHILARLPNSAS